MEFLLLFFGALALGAYLQERVVPDARRRWARWQQQRKADKAEVVLAQVAPWQSDGRYYDATQGNAVLTTCSGCGKSYFMTHRHEQCQKCRGAR
jgi:lipopolysaccharide export LptBFGC system permease protein LptF